MLSGSGKGGAHISPPITLPQVAQRPENSSILSPGHTPPPHFPPWSGTSTTMPTRATSPGDSPSTAALLLGSCHLLIR